ncbi:MAG: M20/M25/M40 family metallo-hydrolase [Ruminococcaceae bacterium]|nr:M20/M25/M40 family metallo-hydrolase [Oscillospiraceae bacterium]
MNFSQFPQAVIKENVDYTVKEITNVIKRYGPRESGNDNCYAVQKHLKKEMDTFCDETGFEEYQMAPKAFLLFTKVVSILFILSVVVPLLLVYLDVFDGVGPNPFFVPQIIAGSVACVSLIIAVLQLGLYLPFADIFHKKKPAHNFYAVRKPQGEVKKRIIVSGHVDAAYEWRHILYSKYVRLMFPLMAWTILGVIISIIVTVLSIVATYKAMGTFGEFMVNYGFYIHFFTVIGMIFLFYFVDFSTISPGANDNLTGTYAAVCAIRMLDMAGVELKNTEVVAMVTDGEEAGLKGTKAWAKAHREEYLNGDVETAVLCVDTLTDLEYFNIYSHDMNSLVKNDKEFSDFVKAAAEDAGIEDMKFASVFMGSSDAAAFSQAGIKATAIAAMDPAPADYYHNRRDNYDRLVPEAIEAGYKVVLSTILKFDEE